MTDLPPQQGPTDAPQTITTNPNRALPELFSLAQTNPAEFRREVDQINRTTDLSFLANGKHDMQIVGFGNLPDATGAHHLILQNKADHSLVQSQYTDRGLVQSDASTAPYRLDIPAKPGVPQGAVTRSAHALDFNYPGGRHIHMELGPNDTPMTFTDGTETLVRQMANGQPTQNWVDAKNPAHVVNMEPTVDTTNGSINMQFGDGKGHALGSSIYNLDGTKVTILGDLRSGPGQIQNISTPDGRWIDLSNGGLPQTSYESFKDNTGDTWQMDGDGFVDSQRRRRTDVRAFTHGAIGVYLGNQLVVYRPDGKVNE